MRSYFPGYYSICNDQVFLHSVYFLIDKFLYRFELISHISKYELF